MAYPTSAGPAIDVRARRQERAHRTAFRCCKDSEGFLRIARYSGASIAAAALAQAGLAIGYGALRWPVWAAVVLSLLVSVGPSYLMNGRWVWRHRASGSPAEMAAFAGLAVFGAVVTIFAATAGAGLARSLTTNRGVLTLVVNGCSIFVTVLVWACRYLVLDRLLFPDRPAQQSSHRIAGIQ